MTQEAYLLCLHDRNCIKNSHRFLFTNFLDLVFYFHFHSILHRPHATTPFSEWPVEYFLLILLQGFVIDIDICWKAALLNLPYMWRNQDHRRLLPVITNRWTKLMLWYFLANVNVDGKHSKQIKEIDIPQYLSNYRSKGRFGCWPMKKWSENG